MYITVVVEPKGSTFFHNFRCKIEITYWPVTFLCQLHTKFLINGCIIAVFKSSANTNSLSDVLTITVIVWSRTSNIFLNNLVGMGSSSQDFDDIDPMIVLISSSSNGLNSSKHALVRPASGAYLGWFSSWSLIFFILAMKGSAKSSAKLPESSESRLHLVVP